MKKINAILIILSSLCCIMVLFNYKFSYACCFSAGDTYLTTSSCYAIYYRLQYYEDSCNPTCNTYWEPNSLPVWSMETYIIAQGSTGYRYVNSTSKPGIKYNYTLYTPPVGPPSCTYQGSASQTNLCNGGLFNTGTCTEAP